jgi:hypothetical protein
MGCMLMAGMHEMQVAVYQSGALDDSCPDLPAPGPAVVTVTMVSNELRGMTMEVRIVRGGEADAAAGASLNPVTLAYLPPKNYPSGVITLPANFDKPGKYAVLVTVNDGMDMVMTGRQVMTVGAMPVQWIIALILSGVIVAAGFGYYLWDHRRKNKRPSESG